MPTVAYVFTISALVATIESSGLHLTRALAPCYLQYSAPIATLGSIARPMFKGVQTYPICLCETVVDKYLSLSQFSAADDRCPIIPLFYCDKEEPEECLETVWFGPEENRPTKIASGSESLIFACSKNQIGHTSTVAVKITKIGKFDIGNRCKKEALTTFLNDRLERYRKGSQFYYRTLVSLEQIESFCDPRLFAMGAAIRIHYQCVKEPPQDSDLIQKCVTHCGESSFGCLKRCMTGTGYYLYFTQNTKGDTCGLMNEDVDSDEDDEDLHVPWALRLCIYENMNPSWTLREHTIQKNRRGFEQLTPIAVVGMAVLIAPRTVLVTDHQLDKIRGSDKYIAIVMGGSADAYDNIWKGRVTTIVDFKRYPAQDDWHDLAIATLENDIPNTSPVCLTNISIDQSQKSPPLDVQILKSYGWGADPTGARVAVQMLKDHPLSSISPYWGPTTDPCCSHCLCVLVTANDQRTCKGDSGSGLVFPERISGQVVWRVVGLQSKVWGIDGPDGPCAFYGQHAHALFNDLRYFRDWICDQLLGFCHGFYETD